jgi:hypothetical protein
MLASLEGTLLILECLLATPCEMRYSQHMVKQQLKKNLTTGSHTSTYHGCGEGRQQGFSLLWDAVVLVQKHSILKEKEQSQWHGLWAPKAPAHSKHHSWEGQCWVRTANNSLLTSPMNWPHSRWCVSASPASVLSPRGEEGWLVWDHWVGREAGQLMAIIVTRSRTQ